MGLKKYLYSTDASGIFHKLEEQDDCPPNHVLYIVQCQFSTNKSLPSLQRSIISMRQTMSTLPQDQAVFQCICRTRSHPKQPWEL